MFSFIEKARLSARNNVDIYLQKYKNAHTKKKNDRITENYGGESKIKSVS